jgi:acyl dehydratase
MTNSVTKDRRHFEDLAVGEIITLGRVTVTKDMILTFAREFDPLPFHLDEKAARKSLLGGLASSGWQTGALSLLKWRTPVMVDDTIGGTVTIADLRRSGSHPQWGIVKLDFHIKNQNGKTVMTMRLANLVECREFAA